MRIKCIEITKFHCTNYFLASPILNFEAKNTERYNSWYSQAHQTHLQAGDKTSCFQEWEAKFVLPGSLHVYVANSILQATGRNSFLSHLDSHRLTHTSIA